MVLPAKFEHRLSGGFGTSALMRDAMAGAVTALVTITYCISFSALIFQGPIAGGFTLGLSALLIGTAATGFIVALTSTLTPIDAGPDTPAVAVMSVLAASIAASMSVSGLSEEAVVLHVMAAITISTVLTGLLLLALGCVSSHFLSSAVSWWRRVGC